MRQLTLLPAARPRAEHRADNMPTVAVAVARPPGARTPNTAPGGHLSLQDREAAEAVARANLGIAYQEPHRSPFGERIRRGECLTCGDRLDVERDHHDPADVLTHVCNDCRCRLFGEVRHPLDMDPVTRAMRDGTAWIYDHELDAREMEDEDVDESTADCR